MNIIIGFGVVGKSVLKSIENKVDKITIIDPDKGFEKPKDFPSCGTKVIFICVPTPTKHGRQDLSIISSLLFELKTSSFDGLIIIKSTILPSYAKQLEKEPLRIIHSPEFLDQSKPYEPQIRHIVGFNDLAAKRTDWYMDLFLTTSSPNNFFLTSLSTAAMIKYVHNVHGALKVAFFNEIYDKCWFSGVDYREMLNGLLWANDHVGKGYTQIALDGQRGFGGACYPKDIIAFNSEYSLKTLAAAIEYNMQWNRPEMNKCLEPVEPIPVTIIKRDGDIFVEDDCGNICKKPSTPWPYGEQK